VRRLHAFAQDGLGPLQKEPTACSQLRALLGAFEEFHI
jgi:hypothetical protein